MAIITKSIGTTGRDYSTITAWEADLDNAGVYSSGDDAVGECYNDSVFDEALTIDGGSVIGLNSITLTVPVAERHDGTAGTGARIVRSSGSLFTMNCDNTVVCSIEWLEIDSNDIANRRPLAFNQSVNHKCRNVIIHNAISTSSVIGISGGPSVLNFMNSIVYNMTVTGSDSSDCIGISMDGNADATTLQNCTIFNIINNNGSGNCFGTVLSDQGTRKLQNVISMDTSGTTSGTIQDFNNSSYSTATAEFNLSSDTSASGTGSLINKVAANQFVSTVGGSEDLHIKGGSDAIDAGTDLGTTPLGIEIDINGRDRDAQGDVWDIGVHELVRVTTPFGVLGGPVRGPLTGRL